MTLVKIDLKNVGSGTNPVDKVIFYSPVYRDGTTSSELISTAEYAVPLVNGVGSINLAPGPVRVRFSVKGIADTVAKEGIVPNSGTVSLNKVIEGSFTYTPAITNEALKKITTAKNNALGEVAGAVESEVDKIIAIGEEFPKVKANADRAEQMSALSMASMVAAQTGVPMPYACTTLPQTGANVLQIAEGHRNRIGSGASTIFEVPDGVSTITASWDGPQGVNVDLRDNVTGVRKTLGKIPPGTGTRQIVVSASVVGTGHGIQCFLDTVPAEAQAGARGSIGVIPFPLFGQ